MRYSFRQRSPRIGVDFVLLDDKAARRVAALLGLRSIGVLGVLLRAKRAGLIGELRPRLEKLEELPFHIAPRLREMVLRDAGE